MKSIVTKTLLCKMQVVPFPSSLSLFYVEPSKMVVDLHVSVRLFFEILQKSVLHYSRLFCWHSCL